MFDGLTQVTAGAAAIFCTMLSAARCGRTKRSMCAPSKLSDPTPVPTTAATDRAVHPVPPPYDADAHVTVVPDVHDALLHANISTSDAVGSCELKFSPQSDTEAPPVGAMFDGPFLVTAGAAQTRYSRRVWQADAFRACAPSKLNDPNDPPTPVPTMPLTLTPICAVPPRYDAAPH